MPNRSVETTLIVAKKMGPVRTVIKDLLTLCLLALEGDFSRQHIDRLLITSSQLYRRLLLRNLYIKDL